MFTPIEQFRDNNDDDNDNDDADTVKQNINQKNLNLPYILVSLSEVLCYRVHPLLWLFLSCEGYADQTAEDLCKPKIQVVSLIDMLIRKF